MSVEAKLKTAFHFHPSLQSNRLKIILALLAVYIIWSSTYLVLRFVIVTLPPLFVTGLRFTTAGGLLYGYLRLRGAPVPTWVECRGAILVGLLLIGAGSGAVAFAEQWVASGLAALAVAAVPVWASLFAGLWGRWPNGLEWGGLGLGLLGVALLNMENGLQASPLGALVLIIGPICWALGSIWSRHVRQPKGMMATAIQMFGGGMAALILGMITGETVKGTPDLIAILGFFYLLIFGSLVAFSAYMFLLGQVRPALATSYAYVNPVMAVILGVVVAGEQITIIGVIAMFVILTGVGLIMFARERK